jgi:hypothetical protein
MDEWTPEERARLAEVGRHRSPRSELKGRTTRTLREHGLLGGAGHRGPRWQVVLGLAAAIVIFVAGMLTGYGVGLRHQPEARRDLMLNTAGGPAHEVARLDSPSTQSPDGSARHVIWF